MELGRPIESGDRIAIVGGGPAGTSVAIRLALEGFRVTLLERERFPRHKLCGEFISPECLRHFHDLGVAEKMLGLGGRRISETRFYSMNGRSADIPSTWLGNGGLALSLSRAEMDMCLLERARAVGIDVHDGCSVVGVEKDGTRVTELAVRNKDGMVRQIAADAFIDATGRNAILTKLLNRHDSIKPSRIRKPSIIGFKAHLRNTQISIDRCEIYSFPGGYGGLSPVERGLANLCFMIRAERVRELGGSADRILRELIFQNKRAYQTLSTAEPADGWLSVAVSQFGERSAALANNVFAVGDAKAFIDPFTGSGMLMAFESSEILATCIAELGGVTTNVTRNYDRTHTERFRRRLAICRVLRNAAFIPALGTVAVSAMSASTGIRRALARSTRHAEQPQKLRH